MVTIAASRLCPHTMAVSLIKAWITEHCPLYRRSMPALESTRALLSYDCRSVSASDGAYVVSDTPLLAKIPDRARLEDSSRDHSRWLLLNWSDLFWHVNNLMRAWFKATKVRSH